MNEHLTGEQAMERAIEEIERDMPDFWSRVEYHDWLSDQLGCKGMFCPSVGSSGLCAHTLAIGAAMVARYGED